LEIEVTSREYGEMPKCPVKITMNIGNPHLAFDFQALPNWGVGLARLECVINSMIGVHPKAALEYPDLPADLKREVEHAARGYRDPRSFFVEKMTEGVATIAAAFWPKPVIVRLSDFKSNEYKKLIGGARYEPDEENPMLGLDRDSGLVADAFDERDPAVKAMLRQAIQVCRKAGKYVGICGQGPSDHLDFAKWLVHEGIESLSLNPDTVVETWLQLAREADASAKAKG